MTSPPTSTKATIHWHKVISKEPGRYLGWPTIAKLPSGELVVVFSGDREEHVCPYGKTELVRSADGGKNWTPPETVNDSLIDDRDAGIVAMKSGTLVVSWFTYPTWEALDRHRASGRYPAAQIDAWAAHCDTIRSQAERQGAGHLAWTRRSTDGGRTWEPPVNSSATSPHGPIELADGRLFMVGNVLRGDDGLPKAEPIVAMDSNDEGRSWRQIGTVMPVTDESPAFNWCEPHVMELEDGTLICLARYIRPSDNARDRYMRQSESMDGGWTWTRPHPSNMWGFPPHLLRLSNGDGLATYGYRRQPFGQRACVYQRVRENLIGGNSSGNWDIGHAIVLRDDGKSDDLGYPATVELSQGEMLTVYYQADKPGEKTSIIATRWTLSLANRANKDDLLE